MCWLGLMLSALEIYYKLYVWIGHLMYWWIPNTLVDFFCSVPKTWLVIFLHKVLIFEISTCLSSYGQNLISCQRFTEQVRDSFFLYIWLCKKIAWSDHPRCIFDSRREYNVEKSKTVYQMSYTHMNSLPLRSYNKDNFYLMKKDWSQLTPNDLYFYMNCVA